MRVLVSRSTSTASINYCIPNSENQNCEEASKINKTDAFNMLTDDYCHEAIYNFLNKSNVLFEDIAVEIELADYKDFEKASYSEKSSSPDAQKSVSNNSNKIPANNVNELVRDEGAGDYNMEETPDIILDAWDAYLKKEYPELYKLDFKVPAD